MYNKRQRADEPLDGNWSSSPVAICRTSGAGNEYHPEILEYKYSMHLTELAIATLQPGHSSAALWQL